QSQECFSAVFGMAAPRCFFLILCIIASSELMGCVQAYGIDYNDTTSQNVRYNATTFQDLGNTITQDLANFFKLQVKPIKNGINYIKKMLLQVTKILRNDDESSLGTFDGERLDNSSAESKGLSTTCPAGYSLIAGQCLSFSDDLLSNSDAEKACKSKGGTLASVKDPQALLDYTKDNYDNYFWLSGSDEEKGIDWQKWVSGTLIKSIWRWNNVKLVPADFPWAARQPDNATESEHCIMLGPDGYHDKGCDSQLPFVCEPQECPESLGFFRLSTKCYKIFLDAKRTFADAKSHCESNNLRFAQPLESHILDLGYYVANNYAEDRVWLGARGNGYNQVWLDGNIVNKPGANSFHNRDYRNDMCLTLSAYQSELKRNFVILAQPCYRALLPVCEL
ncbi:unnamed protein product, partial [Meganyctiphanes norvegica]